MDTPLFKFNPRMIPQNSSCSLCACSLLLPRTERRRIQCSQTAGRPDWQRRTVRDH
jgi:hypothetical protein